MDASGDCRGKQYRPHCVVIHSEGNKDRQAGQMQHKTHLERAQ